MTKKRVTENGKVYETFTVAELYGIPVKEEKEDKDEYDERLDLINPFYQD